MLKKFQFIYILSLLYGFFFSYERLLAFEPYDVNDYLTQLYSDVVPLEFGIGENGKLNYYRVQSSHGDYLYLGANEVFFSRIGSLKLDGIIKNKDMDLNNGSEFRYIRGFRYEQDGLEWGFITTNRGNIFADFFIDALSPQKDIGTTLSVQIDDREAVDVLITEEMINNGYFSLDFVDLADGFHTVKVTLIKVTKTHGLRIINVRLTGEGTINSYVARERYRPNAVYSEWKSSFNPNDVKAWIIELSSDSELGHYSPITTNHGYFGPIFQPNGYVERINMSIWSSGKNEDLLKLDQRSHLLGIGSDQGRFAKWGHEGSGVKVRDWNNFASNTSKKYVIGLRYTEEGDFRTFYGYFWNEETNRWQLYSVGRKLIKAPLDSLKTKAFIEVVAGAYKERSGHVIRKVKYRGWVRDTEGVWSDLDQIKIKKGKELSNKKYGITEDGEYFYASTGGFQSQMPNSHKQWKSKPLVVERPIYMKPSKLKGFDRLPFVPLVIKATINADNTISVSFKTKTSLESIVTICTGEENALTNREFWDQCTDIDVSAGNKRKVHKVTISASPEDRYLRLLVSNQQAQMWSFETYNMFDPN